MLRELRATIKQTHKKARHRTREPLPRGVMDGQELDGIGGKWCLEFLVCCCCSVWLCGQISLPVGRFGCIRAKRPVAFNFPFYYYLLSRYAGPNSELHESERAIDSGGEINVCDPRGLRIGPLFASKRARWLAKKRKARNNCMLLRAVATHLPDRSGEKGTYYR